MKTVASWTKFAASGVVLEHPLELDPKAVKAGQTVWVRAVAQDRRQLELPELKLGPQESATPWQPIHIVAAEAKAKVDLAQLESLQDRAGPDPPGPAQGSRRRGRLAQELDGGRGRHAGRPTSAASRLAVQKAATAVTESIGPTEDPERLTIKRVVGKLAFGEMVQAIRQAEALEQVSSSPSWPGRRPS